MINLTDYGFSTFFKTQISNCIDLIPARVTAVHKERYELVCKHGLTYARLKTSIYYSMGLEPFPTTGDFVMIQYIEAGDSLVVKTLERKTYFSRRDPTPGRGEQAVAANFDYIFILVSLNHDFNVNRTQRYITLAWQSGGIPIIVLTKSDLCADYSEQIKKMQEIAPAIDVIALSAQTGHGLIQLSPYLGYGKTIVFLGSSGVGKSSLVNALNNAEIMKTNSIREDDSKGRHTTTHRQLIKLFDGSLIIDTPGMRELGMWDVSVGLGETFSDIEDLFTQCKFTNCHHETEPGCAVKAAIQSGDLSIERWQNYGKLKNEAKFTDDKANYLKSKQAWQKSIAEHNRYKKKKGGK